MNHFMITVIVDLLAILHVLVSLTFNKFSKSHDKLKLFDMSLLSDMSLTHSCHATEQVCQDYSNAVRHVTSYADLNTV